MDININLSREKIHLLPLSTPSRQRFDSRSLYHGEYYPHIGQQIARLPRRHSKLHQIEEPKTRFKQRERISIYKSQNEEVLEGGNALDTRVEGRGGKGEDGLGKGRRGVVIIMGITVVVVVMMAIGIGWF